MINGQTHPPRPTDGGVTIGPEDQLLGLMLKHGIRPSAVRLQFQHPDLSELSEMLRGSEDYGCETGANEGLTVEYYRKQLLAHPNDSYARLAVWLADWAAPTAVDPDNPLEDPHDIVQRLAEQIRGRNDRPPSSSAEQTAPSPAADQKPATKGALGAREDRIHGALFKHCQEVKVRPDRD